MMPKAASALSNGILGKMEGMHTGFVQVHCRSEADMSVLVSWSQEFVTQAGHFLVSSFDVNGREEVTIQGTVTLTSSYRRCPSVGRPAFGNEERTMQHGRHDFTVTMLRCQPVLSTCCWTSAR
jgi:hypothetical protein